MKYAKNSELYQMGSQNKWTHLGDKLKIKPMINYIQNYQPKWKEHMNTVNTERISKQNFMLSAKRAKNNQISNKEMSNMRL